MSPFWFFFLLWWLPSFIFCVGWQFANLIAQFGDNDWEEHLGFSIVWCAFFCIFGWVAVFIVFCITGFAKHGWRVTPPPQSDAT